MKIHKTLQEDKKALLLFERWLDKIEHKGDCWIWKGYLNHGLGRLKDVNDNDVSHTSHRIALYFKTGIMPTRHVSQTCGNKLCCNPDHLKESDGYKRKDYTPKKKEPILKVDNLSRKLKENNVNY